ncbi:MAG TPA: hypothetical protein VLJ86_03400 [Ramlibacter sp.]|nr:hypothetical protein [Ramlibacter sp.]
MPLIPQSDRRTNERYCLAFHVDVEGFAAHTVEIGADSMLFETHAALSPGAHVSLRLRPLGRHAPLSVARLARVMRVEHRGDTYDVAVKLFKPLFPEDLVTQAPLSETADLHAEAESAHVDTDAPETRLDEFEDEAALLHC